jgi:hypothetical protein
VPYRRWMRRNKFGQMYCTEADWTDVADLWHDNPDVLCRNAMWEFLLEQMLFWVNRGVSGFRCVSVSTARCFGGGKNPRLGERECVKV